jgi:hypothetical protein
MSTTFVIGPPQRPSRTGSITDDSGMQRFEVDYGGRWQFSRRLSIRDTAKTEVAVISRGEGRIHHELLAGGQRITMRPAGFNSRKLKINSADDRLEVVGDHQSGRRPLSIIRGGRPAATVTFGKQFTVAITDGKDPVLMLALALTIASINLDHRANQADKPLSQW